MKKTIKDFLYYGRFFFYGFTLSFVIGNLVESLMTQNIIFLLSVIPLVILDSKYVKRKLAKGSN